METYRRKNQQELDKAYQIFAMQTVKAWCASDPSGFRSLAIIYKTLAKKDLSAACHCKTGKHLIVTMFFNSPTGKFMGRFKWKSLKRKKKK